MPRGPDQILQRADCCPHMSYKMQLCTVRGFKSRSALTSSTTGSTYISTVLLSGGKGTGIGEAAADERRDMLAQEHCDTDLLDLGDSLEGDLTKLS
ncbi:hypothetical protein EVAR_80782_1 [Eumeta japonica]|uniref:Uncharacterized protein n=1 Tax=Eumeta variegata TaxID=151549 RepID=A0A4C1XAX6_EUMVA|nr:hypothetical protein EVAR_80782_1 [Eumeta japonica]